MRALRRQQKQSDLLAKALEAEEEQSSSLYAALRVERRARQRGAARKSALEDKIHVLKSAESTLQRSLKMKTADANKAIAMLTSSEENLKFKLSCAMEKCSAEVKWTQNKLDDKRKELKQSRSMISKLKKRCDRSVVVRENAVQRAKVQAKQKCGVYKLKNKGVYTEITRNVV